MAITVDTLWLFNGCKMWKITIFNRQTIYFYGPCSMAMLNHQRVYHTIVYV